ncbi:MAG: YceI family protein [Flavobacteriales bacterium]|nr:YceI family protein [Flavobacteriales bacterium]
MREHFNENYLETEKYPKASFNGNINEDVDLSKDGTYEVTVTGKLLIHGVEKQRTMTGTIIREGDDISLKGQFQVTLSDHSIRIPKVVIANIAEVIDVKVSARYKPYIKKNK